MKKKFLIIGGITLAVILIIGVLWVLKAKNKVGFVQVPPFLFNKDAENLPPGGILLKDVTLRSLSGSKLLWKVKMSDVTVDERSDKLTVKGLDSAELKYGEETELTVKAGGLVRNQRSGNITISDDVKINGKDIYMTTGQVEWIDKANVLRFNDSVIAQLGDLAVVAQDAEYDVLGATLKIKGKVSVSTNGNILKSEKGGNAKSDGSSFVLNGPVTAEVKIASLEEWLTKNKMPKFPEIPKAIKERYNKYKKNKR